MQKWDYLIMNSVGDLDWVELQEHLIKEFGAKGWELCAVTDDVHFQEEMKKEGRKSDMEPRLFIFKKPLEE